MKKVKTRSKRSKFEDDDLPASSISELIREDSTYRRSKKRLEIIMEDIDFKMLKTELFSLHSSRGSTILKGSIVVRDSVRVLIDSSVDEISVRSRATTIKMQALVALTDIEELVSHLSKYLLSKYAKQMKSNGETTITAQRSTVDVYIRIFIEQKKALEGLMKLADLVMTDIDQASYSLSRIKDALELASKDR